MVALEEQRQMQTERLLADVLNRHPERHVVERQVPVERQILVDRPLAPIASLPDSSSGQFPLGQAAQAPDLFRELGMRQYLASFPQIAPPQIHRGGPEPAATGQAVHYHVHLPSRGNQSPFDLAEFYRGFPLGGRYY